MSALLALCSAACYGAADFLGGLASRRASTILVVVIVQVVGLLPLAGLALLVPGAPSSGDLWWGALAGVAGSIGIGLLYRALAIGTMSIVAPTTALCAVVLPVAFDAARGVRLGASAWIGIVLALVAIVLVSRHEGPRAAGDRALPPGLLLAFLSGIGAATFFVALARTRAEAGVWPLVATRSVSFVLFAGLALVSRQPVRVPRPLLRLIAACGVLDVMANALYLFAVRGGALSIVVTLASLYPASTILLARLVMGERLSALQGAGIGCACAAVVLIVGSG